MFNKGGAVDALQWDDDSLLYTKIVDPASLMWTEDDVQAAMKQGDIAYSLSWGIPLVPMNNPDESKVVGLVEIGMMPSVDGKHPVHGLRSHGICDQQKHQASKEGLGICKIHGWAGKFPALRSKGKISYWMESVIEDPEIQKKFPELKKMALQSQYIVNRPLFLGTVNSALCWRRNSRRH